MKLLLSFLMLVGVSSWAQDPSNCHFSDPVSIQTTCSCTGAKLTVIECQGTFGGQGCADLAFFNFCGPTCAIGESSGCNPRGPKLEIPILVSPTLTSEIRRLSPEPLQIAAATCAGDNGAFAEWLAKTSVHRAIRAFKSREAN